MLAEKLFTKTETVKIEPWHVESESCVSRTRGLGVNAKLGHCDIQLLF